MTHVEWRRKKGRPSMRLIDSVNVDLRVKGLSDEQTLTGRCVGNVSHNIHRPQMEVAKDAKDEEEE